MIKVTNISAGPRGLNTKSGPVMLAPGQTADLDFEFGDAKRRDAELAASKATGWFTFEGDSAKNVSDTLDGKTDDELRELLKQKGVQADGRWSHDRLVAEVKKALD